MTNHDLPLEIERRYLIRRSGSEILSAHPRSARITQTYLLPDGDGMSRRVRSIGLPTEGFKYYYTRKRDVSFGERIELEEEVSPEKYQELLAEADPQRRTIEKVRLYFDYKCQSFELDIFSFSERYAILEIELTDINTPVELPPFLDVIAEVTGDARYNNSVLARRLAFPTDAPDFPDKEAGCGGCCGCKGC